MKLLAIETSTEACSAAISINDACAYRYELAPRKHSKLILPMIDSLLSEADIKINALDCICFSHGPGAFTGVRIGISVAQGLAYPHDIPVIGVSSLKTLAQQFSKENDHIATAIDARMNEIYWGLYKKNDEGVMEEITKEKVCAPEDILSPSKNNWMCIGTGWNKNHEKIKHILVRHEQGAGHAAEGYARSSGKPGVLLVTSGPGATNAVTACLLYTSPSPRDS